MNLNNVKAWCLGIGLGVLTSGLAFGADPNPGNGNNPREGQGRPRGPLPAEEFFAHVDTDKDGSITLEEFLAGHKPGGGDQGDRRPQPPKDGDGKRPPPDGGEGPKDRPKPPSLDELFARLDANGDGMISREEFNALPPPPNGDRGEGRPGGGDRPGGDKGDKGQGGQRPPRGEGDQGNRPRPPRDGDQGEGGQRPQPPSPENLFKQLDLDGDGKVTVDEYKKFHEQMQQRGRGPGDRPAGRGNGNGERPRDK